ncbi:MAG: rod shape-determining protein MreC [Candidatus Falkowbacteria bacterium]|nr:rod shape-determining protein MreC [Candidatus Falkowbacteria bacterium]
MNKRPVVTLAVLGGIVAFLIILGATNSLPFIGGIFRAILNPFSTITHQIAEKIRPSSLGDLSIGDIKTKLETVEKENQTLAAENARLLTLEDENKRLRDYLVFAQANKVSLQMAEVISRGVAEDSWHNRKTITLNQGSDQGVSVGLPIVSSEGVLIGKITAVKNNIAEACLLYSADCRLAVSIAGLGKTVGIARGDLGLNVIVELIPQNQEILEKQVIVTSGLESGMPPGLLIGSVSQVIKQSNELWQSAIIEPAADFDNIRFVAILKQ